MSDVVATALITGGFTTLTALTAAVLAHINARRQAATTLAAVRAQADVEIGRIREEHREEARRRREAEYTALLSAMDALDSMGSGWADVNRPIWEQWVEEFYTLNNRVRLSASQPVRDALDALVNDEITPLTGQPRDLPTDATDADYAAAFAEPYLEQREAIEAARERLLDAMRDDVAVHLPAAPAAT